VIECHPPLFQTREMTLLVIFFLLLPAMPRGWCIRRKASLTKQGGLPPWGTRTHLRFRFFSSFCGELTDFLGDFFPEERNLTFPSGCDKSFVLSLLLRGVRPFFSQSLWPKCSFFLFADVLSPPPVLLSGRFPSADQDKRFGKLLFFPFPVARRSVVFPLMALREGDFFLTRTILFFSPRFSPVDDTTRRFAMPPGGTYLLFSWCSPRACLPLSHFETFFFPAYVLRQGTDSFGAA